MESITLLTPKSSFLLNATTFAPLGILYIAAVLKKHMNVQCLDFSLGHTIDDIKYKNVGISFTTPQRAEAYKIAKELKEKGHYLIAGGAHPTHMPQECFANGFDVVYRGEAEVASFCFLSQIKGVINEGFGVENLDTLPFPDRDALPIHKYEYYINDRPATTIMTSRGCPSSCSFCARISDKFRMQSAKRTTDEIFHIRKEYGFRAYQIFDDTFIASKKRLGEITDTLKNEDFLFRCFGRADSLKDEEICSMLKQLGVVEVGVGVESGSNEILGKNFKRTTSDINAAALTNLHKYGIRAKTFIIIGLPGETEKTIEETRNWIKKNKPDDVDFSVFQPYPGSPIFNDPIKYEVEFEYEDLSFFKGIPGTYKSNCRTKELTAEQIVKFRDGLESEFKDRGKLK